MRIRYTALNSDAKLKEHRYKVYFLLILLVFSLFIIFSGVLSNGFSYKDRNKELQELRKKFVINGSLDKLWNDRFDPRNKNSAPSNEIAIVVVVTKGTSIQEYDIAIQSMRCYAKIHSYDFVLAVDSDFGCPHEDKFFRRHCVVAKLLPRYKTILFIDADIGVVNPKKKIESFMADGIDITFYDRFYNWEITTGTYIVRNTEYAIDFLNGYADYEFKLPRSFHGADNGALHIYLADKVLPHAKIEIEVCQEAYIKSQDFVDLFTYEACIRSLLGVQNDFGKVRIMTKGTGWARDDWLTSGKWNPDMDFMLHGWKTRELQYLPDGEIQNTQMFASQWYNPLAGPIHLDKCNPSNTTWAYEPRLIADKSAISNNLNAFRRRIVREQIDSIARLPNVLDKRV